MTPLAPAIVASFPETAVLDILQATLETAIVALLAAHPRLQRDDHPPAWCSNEPSACCLAGAIIELGYALDNAIIHYRDTVEADLDAERRLTPPF